QRELASCGRRAALAARDHGVTPGRGQRLLDEHREELQALRRLDAPRRTARDEDADPWAELQLLPADGRDGAPPEHLQHLVALVVAVLVASAVEAQQSLLELGNGEERRDGPTRLRRLHAVPHEASLPVCCPS